MEIEADQKHVDSFKATFSRPRECNWVQSREKQLGTVRDNVSERNHAMCVPGAGNQVPRALSKPKAGHMTQVKRVARHLKGVPRTALQYPAQDPSRVHLEVHVDSDWAGDTATRRSMCGEDHIRSDTAQQYKT